MTTALIDQDVHRHRRGLMPLAALACAVAVGAAEPRFFADDPLSREPETRTPPRGAVGHRPLLRPRLQPVRHRHGARRRTSARRTSTPSTRCRIRAGSPTGSAPGRCRSRSCSAVPIDGPGAGACAWTSRAKRAPATRLGSRPPTPTGRRGSCRSTRPAIRTARPAPSSSPPRSSGRSATTRSSTSSPRSGPKPSKIGDKATKRRPSGRRTPMDDSDIARSARTGAPQPGRHVPRRGRPDAPGQGARRLQVRGHAPRRSQRRRPARAPARAARAARLRRVDEPHRHEGRQHARHASSPRAAAASSATTCRTSARRSASAPTVRTTGTRAGSTSTRAAPRGGACSPSGSTCSPWQTGAYEKHPRSAASKATRSIPTPGSRARRPPPTSRCATTTRSGRRGG